MSGVTFIEKTHQYFNKEGVEYISVSGLAKRLEKKKDWDAIKKKYAKKKGLTVKEVEADWDRKKLAGTTAGTLYHFKREQELLSSEPQFEGKTCQKKPCSFLQGVKESIPIERLDNNTVYPELIIYDHDLGIAGQADKVYVIDNTIFVYDYKTDKSIDRKAFSSDWVEPEKLEAPVGHLDNCNFNMYSLKMSMYMFMLWKQNKHLKVGKLILEHVQLLRDDEGVPILDLQGQPQVVRTEMIEVPYRRKEVRDVLEAYRLNQLN